MENLMFCLNATGPIFLMMVFGLFLRKVGILDEDFANRMNKFVFKIPLPFYFFTLLKRLVQTYILCHQYSRYLGVPCHL